MPAALHGMTTAGLSHGFQFFYRTRRDVFIDGLRQAGWEVPIPDATMFAWAPIPPTFHPIGSLAFSKLLLEQANVAVSPGIGFGEYGEGYLRFSYAASREAISEAIERIREFLGNLPTS